jgi:hypothetical protein
VPCWPICLDQTVPIAQKDYGPELVSELRPASVHEEALPGRVLAEAPRVDRSDSAMIAGE